MRYTIFLLFVLVFSACARDELGANEPVTVAAPASPQPAPKSEEPPESGAAQTIADVPADAAPRELSALMAVAHFKKDELDHCHDIAAVIRPPGGVEPAISPSQVAMLVMDDALLHITKGATAMLLDAQGRAKLGEFLDNAARADQSKIDEKLREMLAQVVWPLPTHAKEIERGELVQVQSCASFGRVELGRCAAVGGGDIVAWSLTRHHYDVASTSDSDRGMRACLRLGGQWSAPSKDDPAAARERLRQRAGRLRRLTE